MIPPGVVLDARTASDHFPGIGRFVRGLSRALAEVGSLSLIHGLHPDARLPVPPLRGIACGVSPFGWQQHWRIPGLLRRLDARLYHSPYYLMPFRPGVPSVVTCYDVIPLLEHGALTMGGLLAWRIAHRLAFRACAAVCVPSEATRQAVARAFPGTASKLVVVRPGRDRVERPNPEEVALVRSRLGLPSKYVLSVGSNKPHKDLPLLVKSWGMALEDSPDLTRGMMLALAGPRDGRHPEPGATVTRLGLARRVADLGMVSDQALSALYAGATAFVCPSRIEGFGLPLLEAMAHGSPCISSSHPALLETAGGAASVFPVGDARALASALLDLLSDEAAAERLAAAGLARAAAFDWQTAAAATSEVYRRYACLVSTSAPKQP